MSCPVCAAEDAAEVVAALERHTRWLFDDGHEHYALCACRICGQAFLEHFEERLVWDGGDDLVWVTWVPIDAGQAGILKRVFPERTDSRQDLPRLERLAERSPRIVRSPNGRLSWEGWPPDDPP